MPCKLFTDARACRCDAIAGGNVPTLHERERFCRSSDGADCPTFRAFERQGAPLALEAYYSLWITGGVSTPAVPEAPAHTLLKVA